MNLLIRADWTNTSEYFIDFDRGQILHSRAASRGQSNKFFRAESVAGSLKHLTYVQAATFYSKNKVIECYLMYLRQLAIAELGRGIFQASHSYLRNHQRVFDRSLNTLADPVAQTTNVGYVRTPYDRQKLVDYMTKLTRQSINYGQTPYTDGGEVKLKENVVKSLRDIAFAPPKLKSNE